MRGAEASISRGGGSWTGAAASPGEVGRGVRFDIRMSAKQQSAAAGGMDGGGRIVRGGGERRPVSDGPTRSKGCKYLGQDEQVRRSLRRSIDWEK